MSIRNIDLGFFTIDALSSFSIPIGGLSLLTFHETWYIAKEGSTVICVIPKFSVNIAGSGVLTAMLPAQFVDTTSTETIQMPIGLIIDGNNVAGMMVLTTSTGSISFYPNQDQSVLSVTTSIGTSSDIMITYNLI